MNYYAISRIPSYNFLGNNVINKKPINNENMQLQSNTVFGENLSLYGHYIPRASVFGGDETKGSKLNLLG